LGADLEQCSSHSGSNTSLSSCGANIAAANDPLDMSACSDPVLVFSIYNAGAKSKLKPLTEEEVLKMNCIGQDGSNLLPAVVTTAPLAPSSNNDDVSSLEAMRRPQDDASIGNSDNLEAISEAATIQLQFQFQSF